MAATPSTMKALGTEAQEFQLPDTVSGDFKSLTDLRGEKGTLIMFICNHCPYVKLINAKLVEIANAFISKGISFVAISSNDAAKYPDDGPEKMKEVAASLAYPFPYLYDESQDVARAYDAACTPDFFLYDQALKLVYRGQFDDARPGNNIEVTGRDMFAALENLVEQRPIPANQRPSIGCNIKWKNAY